MEFKIVIAGAFLCSALSVSLLWLLLLMLTTAVHLTPLTLVRTDCWDKEKVHVALSSCDDVSLDTDLLLQRAVAAFAVAAADLPHHHDEHGHVQQKHQTEVTDAGGVEDAFILDPAAGERGHKHTNSEPCVLMNCISLLLSVLHSCKPRVRFERLL